MTRTTVIKELRSCQTMIFINPFPATDLFWYPSENIRKPKVFWFSDVSRGVSKEIGGMKWVKKV